MSKEETIELGKDGEEFHDMGGSDKIVQGFEYPPYHHRET